MKFENSTFIVTGGASGLGEATVRSFHAAGANVVIADLNTELGEQLAAELGSRAAFQRTNVADEADAKACVALASSRFGGLQGLVNCAGIGNAAKVLGKEGPLALDAFAKVVTVNLIGTFNMIRLAADAMSKGEAGPDGERGVIINTASVAAYEGQIGQAAYAASKGGIVAMTLPIARELARSGIRVMTIAPGLFITPMMHTLPADVQASLGASVPFPSRLGQPSEYAALAKHIVDNVMLNGETIRLDGATRLAAK
ncbi:MAG: 3-hydroxyacyl-CoA dehydrogenase [Zoogloea oleivorans]|jgi:NAD(P)-dependent dehydrogenase (short-subunit alcohol dehydrogenase family)|uniref:3-hydroxyacyl-CoA dehydrogenase n=1 Tax=Zoogloea oleivorans TaxID=1552750 RepID=A0A6C2CXN2_9RHOO|nr:3-hydroxyacyl-CoA dehydrogenase [Zoogloea oleivorans]MDY0037524.1 3-hydroxyacyl-CoA dehydrogenase [Zoogloea oleivorans]TYC58867.1 3-hydroxyacyl-CoA dehydrogenase [Zoogloea oleivorans]